MSFPFVLARDLRTLEALAVERDTSYEALMERAGRSVADHLIESGVVCADSSVLVLCGKGNNGGDGYVIARHLASAFPSARIVVLKADGDPVTDLCGAMKDRLLSQTNVPVVDELPPEPFSVVVDAIYGIGFRGIFSENMVSLLEKIRSYHAFVAAVDIPSGMHADVTAFDDRLLKADVTITFTGAKRVMCFEHPLAMCGEIVVKSVGIAEELVAEYVIDPDTICSQEITEQEVATSFPLRPQHSHKGTFGQVHAFCGSYGMAGAAMLCGEAALRCGVGLLHMYIQDSIYPIVASGLWEAVFHPLVDEHHTITEKAFEGLQNSLLSTESGVVLCGPGLSRAEQTAVFLRRLLPNVKVPVVLDADGINAFVGHIHELKAIGCAVLTPHPAEAARLLDCTVAQIEENRALAALTLAKKTGAVVVLKGHRTIVAHPSGQQRVNVTGGSGLAKGGSGDVLTGMIASLMAQGMLSFEAACAAVFLHGEASHMTASRLSERGMLPRDLLEDVPKLLSKFEKRG